MDGKEWVLFPPSHVPLLSPPPPPVILFMGE